MIKLLYRIRDNGKLLACFGLLFVSLIAICGTLMFIIRHNPKQVATGPEIIQENITKENNINDNKESPPASSEPTEKETNPSGYDSVENISGNLMKPQKNIDYDEEHLYGKGKYVLSDEEIEGFMNRAVDNNAQYLSDYALKSRLDNIIDSINSGYLEYAIKDILNVVDNYYFDDSCYSRELYALYKDSSVMGAFIDDYKEKNQNTMGNIACLVNNPKIALIQICLMDNPYKHILNRDSYYVKDFKITSAGEHVDYSDYKYQQAGAFYPAKPVDIFKFEIQYENTKYNVFTCTYEGTVTKILQFETPDGSLKINENAADLNDYSNFTYDSGIYNYQNDLE